MNSLHTGTIQVPGADLYYRWRGNGPWLLILHGGAADADAAEALTERLGARYRVLTHDRRGLSRSRTRAAAGVSRIEEHTDDVHHLLHALGAEPACVLGVSIGAIIGLDLITRYPEQVRTLIAQEPPLTYLLPPVQCAEAVSMQEELETTLVGQGVQAALRKFMLALEVDVQDVEDGFEQPKLNPSMFHNYEHFLRYDAPNVRKYRLDLDALARRARDIVPVIGARTHESLVTGKAGAALKVAPTMVLAERLRVGLRVLPGGHGGYASHPRDYGARLMDVLAEHARQQAPMLAAGSG